MAFRKDKTTAAQTAANGAATVTAALVTAGVIADTDTAMSFHDSLYDQTFAKLGSVVEGDNVVFAEAEAADPPKSSSRAGSGAARGRAGDAKGGGKSGPKVLDDPGSMEFIFGSFKGLTIAEVYELDEDQCAEYGYPSKGDPKTGRDYIVWCSKNQDEKAAYSRTQALAFLESKRAGSDE